MPRGFQSTGVAIVTAASYAGAAFAAGVAPWIIDEFDWPTVFYTFGASAVLWLPFWALITPAAESRGSAEVEQAATSSQDAESAPLNRQRRDASTSGRDTEGGEGLLLRPAEVLDGSAFGLDRAFWGLAKRKEVWAICAAQYCQSWGMYALLNWLPTFFSEQVRRCSSIWQISNVLCHILLCHPMQVTVFKLPVATAEHASLVQMNVEHVTHSMANVCSITST